MLSELRNEPKQSMFSIEQQIRFANIEIGKLKGTLKDLMPIGGKYFYTVSSGFMENYDATPQNQQPAMIKGFGIRAILRLPGVPDFVVLIEADMYKFKEAVIELALRRMVRRLQSMHEREKFEQFHQRWSGTPNEYSRHLESAPAPAVYSASSATGPTPLAAQVTTVDQSASQKITEQVVDDVKQLLTEEEMLEQLLAEQESEFNKQLAKAEKKKAAEEAARKEANAKASRNANRKH